MAGLDTIKRYETPEGIVLRLNVAGPVARACAWLIDLMIKGAVLFILSLALGFMGKAGMGIFLISLFLIEWFYPVLFEVISGATPGKKTFKLIVIHDNGTPVSFSSSVLRNLIRTADFFPFFYGTGLIAMVANRDFKRLGDMAAGTLVVYSDQNETQPEIAGVKSKQPPSDLRVNEQRTILDFAERSRMLSKERSVELAELLEELTGKTGHEATEELYAYASWLFKGK